MLDSITDELEARGYLCVPINQNGYKEAKVEPVLIAVLRGAANTLTVPELERMQKMLNYNLEIFRPALEDDTLVLTLPVDYPPQLFQDTLSSFGWPVIACLLEALDLEKVVRKELRSSLTIH